MANRRVLVTGANGFVGRALCAELTAAGDEVSAAVRTARPGAGSACRVIPVGDIDAGTDWSRALEGVDAVVHLAARTHVTNDRTRGVLGEFRRINVQGSVRLAEQALASGVRRFVFLSSVKVNGELTRESPFRETDLPQPGDAYGISKWEAELGIASAFAPSSMQLTILRAPLLYGAGAKGNLFALMRAIERGWPLPIGGARNRRSLLNVRNLSGAIRLCLDHPAAADATFLVADEPPISSVELARALGHALKRPARLVPVPVGLLRMAGALLGRGPAIERLTSSLVVDSTAIRTRLGWRPQHTFAQGIADMVDGYLARAR